MQIFTLLFLLGICSVQLFSHLPSLIFLTILIMPIMVWCYLPTPYRKIGQYLSAFLLGFCWMICQAHWLLSLQLPQTNDPIFKMIGTVISIPEQHNHAIMFNFAVTQIEQTTYLKWHPYKFRITWYGQQPEHLRVGDKWQLTIRLNKPHVFTNPAGFDYQKWLFESHLNAIGTVQNSGQNLLLRINRYSYPIDRFRQLINEKLQVSLYGLPLAGMIIALCIGIRDHITQQQWQALRNTGTNHLMAIAGLHISCIASMTYFLVNFCWRRFAFLITLFPVQQAASLISLIAAIIYSALAGFSLPTQRAVIMLSVFLLSTLLRRHISAWNAYYLALFIILFIDPFDTLSASFWLSFGTVALIIYGNSARLKMQGIWWHWGRTQWVIGLGIMPLSLLFFQQVSLISFITNSIAIPAVGFIILPLCFTGSLLIIFAPYIGKLFIVLAEHLLNYLWIILEKLSSITIMQWYAGINQQWLIFSMIMCVTLLLAPRGWPARWLGVFWAAPLIFYKISMPLMGQIDVTLLDAAKNEIAIIKTAQHILLYEVLEDNNKNNIIAQQIIKSYLLQNGIKKVDQIYTNVPQIYAKNSTVSVENLNILSCVNDKRWRWDNVDWHLQSLSPNNSDVCVLNISNNNSHLILLNHLTSDIQQDLQKLKQANFDKTIVIIPHEKNNLPNVNNTQINNEQLIFILGSYNTRKSADQLLQFESYSTQKCGTIHFVVATDGSLDKIDCYKVDDHYFWQEMNS